MPAETSQNQNKEAARREMIENKMMEEKEMVVQAELAEAEEETANQLAIEQKLHQISERAKSLYEKARSYKNPSKFKFGILFVLASIVDVIDSLTLTGFGWLAAVIVSIVISTIILLIFWFTNTKQKEADQYKKGVQDFLESLPQNAAHLERRAYQVLKFTKAGKLLKKNPIAKYVLSASANLIPIVNLLPWNIFGVWLSYRDEKESYKDVRETSEEALGNMAQLTSDYGT